MRRSPQSVESIETQIAKAAIELGPNLESFSVQELAKAANIAVGTIYRIMPSKSHLQKIVQNYAQSEFEKIVLAPMRLKGDMFERFNLVFERIVDFTLANSKIGQYLALNGFDEVSAFKKAIAAFVREISPMAAKSPNMQALGYSLIWGPIATLLMMGDKSRENYLLLSPKIYATIAN